MGARAEQGWVAPHIAAEFPGLGIAWVEVDCRPGQEPRAGASPPPRPLRPLLRRPRDPHARTADSLGLPGLLSPDRPRPGPDPDAGRAAGPRSPPRRCLQEPGASRRRADDRDRGDRGRRARLSTPSASSGGLCIRDSAPGESLPGRPGELAQGTLAIADERGPVGPSLRATAEGCGVEAGTRRRLTIAAVQVKGVPQIAVDEALWMAAATLGASRP